MSKVMRSYRLDEGTTETLRETADYLGMSQADVIALAMVALDALGIDYALSDAADMYDVEPQGYAYLVRHAARGWHLREPVRNAVLGAAELYDVPGKS